MTDTVQNTIDRARAVAAATPPLTPAAATPPPMPPAAPPTGVPAGAGVPTTGRGPALTLNDMTQGSIQCDIWLKVTPDGIKVGDSGLIEDVEAEIDFTEIAWTQVVKIGSPATYYKSFDGVTTDQGVITLIEAEQLAKQAEPGHKGRYRSADIPMTVLKPVMDIKGNKVIEAGTLIGHSLSTTNWRNFEGLIRAVSEAGYYPESAKVEVRMTAQSRSNPAGHNWGVLKFDLLNVVDGRKIEAAA